MIIRIQEELRRKLNNLKPLFSGNEEHCISKEVKGNALAVSYTHLTLPTNREV